MYAQSKNKSKREYSSRRSPRYAPKSKGGLVRAWMIFLLWVGIIIIFANQSAEDVTELSYQTVDFTIHIAEQLRIIPNDASVFGGLFAESGTHSGFVNEWGKNLEHLIHILFFFVLALLTLNALHHSRMKAYQIIIITIMLCSVIVIGNEFYQEIVEGRAWEQIDVVHNFTGTAIGIIVYEMNRWMFRTTVSTNTKHVGPRRRD